MSDPSRSFDLPKYLAPYQSGIALDVRTNFYRNDHVINKVVFPVAAEQLEADLAVLRESFYAFPRADENLDLRSDVDVAQQMSALQTWRHNHRRFSNRQFGDSPGVVARLFDRDEAKKFQLFQGRWRQLEGRRAATDRLERIPAIGTLREAGVAYGDILTLVGGRIYSLAGEQRTVRAFAASQSPQLAQVLNFLRQELGDEADFKVGEELIQQERMGVVSTEDLAVILAADVDRIGSIRMGLPHSTIDARDIWSILETRAPGLDAERDETVTSTSGPSLEIEPEVFSIDIPSPVADVTPLARKALPESSLDNARSERRTALGDIGI